MRRDETYEDLLAAALEAPFSGWNFDYLDGRVRECVLPWSYEDLARTEIGPSSRILDLNTGGGETLLDVLQSRRPAHVVATESWPPNISVAREHLEPRGVALRPHRRTDPVPAEDGEFNLVLNRHGACDLAELRRVLTVGGTYLTQAVGRLNDSELNVALDGPELDARDTAMLELEEADLIRNGFEITDSGEAFVEYGFLDIGAVVFHLKAVPWQVPGFDVTTYEPALRRLDAHIRETGEFVVRHHRYFIRAVRS